MPSEQNAGQNQNMRTANKSFEKSGKVQILGNNSNIKIARMKKLKRTLNLENACYSLVQKFFFFFLFAIKH